MFFARRSSKRTSQETAVCFIWVKRSGLSVAICRFRSILFVSIFQGLSSVTIIMIQIDRNGNILFSTVDLNRGHLFFESAVKYSQTLCKDILCSHSWKVIVYERSHHRSSKFYDSL